MLRNSKAYAQSIWVAGPPGLEGPGPPAPMAEDIKRKFLEETIKWKHVSVMIIMHDIHEDNLETQLGIGIVKA